MFMLGLVLGFSTPEWRTLLALPAKLDSHVTRISQQHLLLTVHSLINKPASSTLIILMLHYTLSRLTKT